MNKIGQVVFARRTTTTIVLICLAMFWVLGNQKQIFPLKFQHRLFTATTLSVYTVYLRESKRQLLSLKNAKSYAYFKSMLNLVKYI